MNFYSNEEVFSKKIGINILPSLIIESFCSSENCEILTGNLIENVKNKISVKTFKFAANKIIYSFNTPYESFKYENVFDSPVNEDWLDNIKFKKVPEDISSYIVNVEIKALNFDNELVETSIPIKVVRPMEVKHFGQYELAQIYEPVPVTGCIPGSVGNTVSYSESNSETRQNSVSISLNKNWVNSKSVNVTNTNSEGLNVGETQGTVNSSSLSQSETQSEGFSSTNSEAEGNNISFGTTDGENWSWNMNETESNQNSTSQSNQENTSINGSTTVGASGEGSLPFLAKASGKVEVSAGIQRGWGNSNSETNTNSNSNSRGYSTGNSSQNSRTYGSVYNEARSHSLTGTYVLSSNTNNTISESSSLSSNRIWNMSSSLSNGETVSEANGENITETIVSSSTSSTTFSYNGYIPRGRFGTFYRQTSRYVKLSEIISYNIDGRPSHAGFIMMNTWSWAPGLTIANSCEEARETSLPHSSCLISPCIE